MSLRLEFVKFAAAPDANIRALCRQFEISPHTAYKWIDRFAAEGPAGLVDRSRQPQSQPRRTPEPVAAEVLKMRQIHPTWGGRKIRARLLKTGAAQVPSPSAITQILRRAGQLDPVQSAKHTPWQRFERAAPNELWQMDFKGHFALEKGRCHPLGVLDDHSRFALVLGACADEQAPTVQIWLTQAFQRYGCPWTMLSDNGAPWGTSAGPERFTTLGVWIMRLGIRLIHGRPAHPQTQGKEERFHRTLKSDVLCRQDLRDLARCQKAFDDWRHIYNQERPHEALGLKTPGDIYRPSARPFPAHLPPIEYGPDDLVKKVKSKGEIMHANQSYYVGRALAGLPVALRARAQDDLLEVYFCHQKIGRIDPHEKAPSKWHYLSIYPPK
jgi:transposase InsO family protein